MPNLSLSGFTIGTPITFTARSSSQKLTQDTDVIAFQVVNSGNVPVYVRSFDSGPPIATINPGDTVAAMMPPTVWIDSGSNGPWTATFTPYRQNLLTAPLGQVATRAQTTLQRFGSNNYTMSRTAHTAQQDITSLQVAWPNWWNNGGVETGRGASAVYAASVEYPQGVFNQITWQGSATVTVADGANSPPHDPLTLLSKIPSGATFWLRLYTYDASGTPHIICSTGFNAGNAGDKFEFGTGAGTDLTVTDSAWADNENYALLPSYIVANTVVPRVGLLGDSILTEPGWSTISTTPQGQSGLICPSLVNGNGIAFINANRPGAKASSVVASQLTTQAMRWCSHVIIEYGRNDITYNGAGAATALIADIARIIALLGGTVGGKKFYVTTITPQTTSTDGWATLVNQTVAGNNAERLIYNAAVRAGLPNVTGYFDVCTALESGSTSKWVPLQTDDGLHLNPAGVATMKASGIISPTMFT